MYAAIWRLLPGPRWFKVFEVLILVAAVVVVLFAWVFPWAAGSIDFLDPTVGDQG